MLNFDESEMVFCVRERERERERGREKERESYKVAAVVWGETLFLKLSAKLEGEKNRTE